jgi:hypothetical protein
MERCDGLAVDSSLGTGISILTSLPTDNVHPTLSVCNAPARLLNAEPFRRPRRLS